MPFWPLVTAHTSLNFLRSVRDCNQQAAPGVGLAPVERGNLGFCRAARAWQPCSSRSMRIKGHSSRMSHGHALDRVSKQKKRPNIRKLSKKKNGNCVCGRFWTCLVNIFGDPHDCVVVLMLRSWKPARTPPTPKNSK